jgi:hypothetical protein
MILRDVRYEEKAIPMLEVPSLDVVAYIRAVLNSIYSSFRFF